MSKVEFTREQEDWLCYAIGEWYMGWKGKMTDNHHPHKLGIAIEQLKDIICGNEPNTLIEDIISGKVKTSQNYTL
jgi:hypothetical protein